MGYSGVNDVQITCHTLSFTLGGSISGLTSSGLVLTNSSDTLTITPNSSTFTMGRSVAYGGAYNITVQNQPTGQTCSVANGSGTMNSSNITAVNITCSINSYTISGNITGLNTSGLKLTNSDTVTAASSATGFTFTNRVAYGGSYSATISSQPKGQFCTISNISVTCTSPTVHIIHSFAGGMNDGGGATTIIQGADGYLYGVSPTGGGPLYQGLDGCGLIFKMSTSGSTSILYSFDPSGNAGYYPTNSLIQASDGNFYGFTSGGGTGGFGALFRITPAGVLTVLNSFTSTSNPRGLIQGSDGNLYCIMSATSGNFSRLTQFTLAGVRTDIFIFKGSTTSSGGPLSFVQGTDGNFYTGSSDGGASNNGTISKITPSGTETILLSLGGVATNAFGIMQASDGYLYVTTSGGGANLVGMVFKISTTGSNSSILHNFQNIASDGVEPQTSLIQGTDGKQWDEHPHL